MRFQAALQLAALSVMTCTILSDPTFSIAAEITVAMYEASLVSPDESTEFRNVAPNNQVDMLTLSTMT